MTDLHWPVEGLKKNVLYNRRYQLSHFPRLNGRNWKDMPMISSSSAKVDGMTLLAVEALTSVNAYEGPDRR